jgi:hypothetical protein
MIRIITIFLGLALIAFIGSLFFSGNIALAIIILMGSLILFPLVIIGIKNNLHFANSPYDSNNASSGGTSGGIGTSCDTGSSSGCDG